MITVTATQLAKSGLEAELQTLMIDLTANVRTHEPGCLTFDWVRDSADPLRFLVVEQYIDEPSFKAHQGTHYLADFVPKLLRCLDRPPEVTVYGDVVPRPSSRPDSYFHIGIVVPDLEVAIARYSDALSVRFTEPATFHVPRLEDPDPHPGTLVAAFSMTAPPYYELIQAAGSGIIAAANAGRILYFACWEADMASRLAWLKARDIGVDALFRMDEHSPPFAMITAPDLLGARIEYVDTSDRAPIEEWVSTGRYPGGIGQ